MCYCELSELNTFQAVHVLSYNSAHAWGHPAAVHHDCTYAH